MHLLAAVDEVASETQLSEGWTYAVLTPKAINKIDAAISACAVKNFHGKTFKASQQSDYKVLLTAARDQLEKFNGTRLLFTLNETNWKAQFLSFAQRVITTALQNVGINDATAASVATHLFPGLITLQRLTRDLPGTSIEVEVDSDNISKLLSSANVTVAGILLPLTRILVAAYEGHRKSVFQNSPALITNGVRVLDDANSRCIQVADVFGNFALSRVFVQLGQTSKTRDAKTQVFDDVFGDIVDPNSIKSAVTLSPPNDIRILQPGGLTLEVGS